MIKKVFLLFLFFVTTGVFAQYQVTIEAIVLDKETKQPIAFANIGFIKKSIGTVSNEKGQFKLVYEEAVVAENEILQISTLGYTTLKIRASKLFDLLSKDNKIYLNPKPYDLDEVVLTNEKREQKIIGTSSFNETTIGYWKDKDALGGEIATKINIKNRRTKLLELKLHVEENLSDSLRVRINVYNYEKRYPKGNLLSTNIYHTITKQEGKETIDLKPYKISVDDDVVIGIELIEVYGDKIGFAVAANTYLGPSYTRYISQDKWQRNLEGGINFSVMVSYPTDKKRKVSIARNAPEKITLYWDTSRPMKDRLLDRELELLSNYLKKIKSTTLEVVKFSAFVTESKQFKIEKGKGKSVIEYLRNTNYDGTSSFANILKQNNFEADAVLLFTSGNTMFSELQSEINVPVFSINTSEKANHLQLQKAGYYSDGHYINLRKVSAKLALELMLNEVDDKTDYTTNQKISQSKSIGNIFGTVSSNLKPLQAATVRVKNSFIEALTDVEGHYTIDAKADDVLIVNYLGMLGKEVLISKEGNVNIDLEPDGEVLEEVVLQGDAKQEELIDTPYGKKHFDAVTFAYDELKKEEISQGIHHLDQVVAKLPGLVIMGFGNNKRYFFARNMSKKGEVPIIVIDDVIYYQYNGLDKLPPIDMQLIESVKAVKSVIGTNRYGGAGAYGAIIIKTQATSFGWLKKAEQKPSALMTGNDYVQDIPLLKSNDQKPDYITQLEESASFETAQNIYKDLSSKTEQLSIPYFINVSAYFAKWDKDYADNIVSNILEIGKNNPKALKVLAYRLEENNRLKEATYVYEIISRLRPNDAQSYRDLALIYVQTGYYSEAIALYSKMLNGSFRDVDFKGLENVITSELKHLLAKHRSKVDYSNVHADYLEADFKYDMRIVFDWNDANTEFEVQFVNPKKKFFTWSQTKFDNRTRMLDGITKGYHTEEFIIDDDELGEWIINIENINEEPQLNPTYLKYTVYKNYGLANETKEVKLMNLNKCKPKINLDKLVNL